MGKVRAYLSRGRDLAARWVQLWNQQRPACHPAAPAYYSMFALAPILYVVLRMATRFFSDPLVIDAVHAALNSLLGRLAGWLYSSLGSIMAHSFSSSARSSPVHWGSRLQLTQPPTGQVPSF